MSKRFMIMNPKGCENPMCVDCYPALALAIARYEILITDKRPEVKPATSEPTHKAPERKQ